MATRDHQVDAALKLRRRVVTLPMTSPPPFVPSESRCRRCFEETKAVTPLPRGQPAGVPDTYPFGV